MTNRNPMRIARIENFAMTGDGAKYAFNVITKQGVAIDLEIEATEMGTLVQYLVANAASMGRQRLEDGFERSEPANSLSPIPTEGIGMASGQTHDTTLLVARLYTFELAFEIPNEHLVGLAESIRRTSTLMSSDPRKAN